MQTFEHEKSQMQIQGKREYEEQTGMTLLEVLGYNSQIKGENSMRFDVVNDSLHISQGSSLNVGPNSNILIQLPEDTTVHDLMTYAICGNLSITGTGTPSIMTALHLFDPLNFMAGSKSYSIAGCDQYPTMNLLTMNKEQVSPYAYGLAYDMDSYANYKTATVASNAVTSGYDSTNGFSSIYQQVMRNNAIRFGPHTTYYSDSLFVVPLMFLFPNIINNLQGYSLYSQVGQVIKFTLKTQNAQRCIFDLTGGNIDGNYTIQNIGLVRQYKELNQEAIAAIKRSKIMFPVREIQPYPISPVTQSNNLVLTINEGERPSRFIFAFAPTNSAPGAHLPLLTNSNIFSTPQDGTHNHFVWSDLVFYPSLPVQLVTIRLGGDTLNFNSQTIKVLHVMQASQGHNQLGDQNYYSGGNVTEGIFRQLQCIYSIDLSPYPFSLTGSDQKGQVNIRVDLDTSNSSSAPQEIQSTDLFSTAPLANLSGLTLYGFLEKIKPLELSNGIYK